MKTTDSKAVTTRVIRDESLESTMQIVWTPGRISLNTSIAVYEPFSVGKCWKLCRSIGTVTVLETRCMRTSKKSIPGARAGVKGSG